MAGLGKTLSSLPKLTYEQKILLLAQHIEGTTSKKLSGWCEAEFDVRYRHETILAFCRSDAAQEIITEMRSRIHELAMDTALAHKAMRIQGLGEEADKHKDKLRLYDFSNVEDKTYQQVLRSYMKLMAQMQGEVENVKTEVEHKLVSPYETWMAGLKEAQQKTSEPEVQ